LTEPAAPPPPEAPPRRRRLVRTALTAALTVLAIVAALAATLRFGVLTDPGRRLIEARLDGLSLGRYGRLHVDGLDGDVFGDFSIRHLTVSDARGAWLDLVKLRVRWNPWALFDHQVDAGEIDAGRLSLLRQPVLGPRTPGAPTKVGVHVGRLAARVEMAPAFSYRYGLYDVAGGFDVRRAGGAAGRIAAVSLTHPGDRLDGVFDLGRDKTVKLSLQAHEAQGGAMAGALGLAADQPFFVSASASGTISRGQFQATSRSGALVPLQGSGAWTPQGGSGQGQVALTASRWLSGYQKMLGPQVSFQIAGAKAADGFFGVTLTATSDNVDLTAKGEADIGRLTTGPGGVAVAMTARSIAPLLAWPPTHGGRLTGTFAGQADRWTLAGDVALDGPAAYGYAVAQVRGAVKLVQKSNQLTLGLDLTGQGGQGAGVLAAMLGARPHGVAELTWLPDGRLLMKSLAVDGPGLKVTGDGQMGLFGGLGFKGEASFSNLAAARAGATGLIKANWTANQDRGDKPWSFTIDAGASNFVSGLGELDRLLGPSPRLKGDATWDGKVAQVGHANLAGAAGDIDAIGQIGGDGALGLKLDWRAKGPFEVGPLEIAGDGQGSGALTGTLTNPRADLAADFAAINLPSLALTAAHVTVSFLQGPADTNGAFTLAASSPYGPAKADTGFRFARDGLDLTGLNAEAGGLHAGGRFPCAAASRRRAT
jgi:translocation and assembly module TamB